ncbi:hypothetical protein [Achromobacter ruhlandii]|nr:hypothetical protein [Achromobacter ruhlandii]AOU96350.1 uncharacterized protein AruCF_5459 [Achromobacter ruhlandii]
MLNPKNVTNLLQDQIHPAILRRFDSAVFHVRRETSRENWPTFV